MTPEPFFGLSLEEFKSKGMKISIEPGEKVFIRVSSVSTITGGTIALAKMLAAQSSLNSWTQDSLKPALNEPKNKPYYRKFSKSKF